jgi:hypothetical protein
MTFGPLLSPEPFFHPSLSPEMQVFVRVAYAVTMLSTLLATLPSWRRFYLSERWGGYAKSAPDVDAIQNPFMAAVILTLWIASLLGLIFGVAPVAAATVNLLFCRYFFVRMRWKGVLRGFGAPGFMSYWTGAAVFFLEVTRHYAPRAATIALLVMLVDWAFIMLSAGTYKATAGYPHSHGMEGGMANPQWGYWWRLWKRLPPKGPLFWIFNQLAWSTEVVAGILMLIPATRLLGALLILCSFVFIASQIRLLFLCETVIVLSFLYAFPGSVVDQLVRRFVHAAPVVPAPVPALEAIISAFCWTYLVLLPVAHAGLFLNFYGKKALPGPFQRALELYTNFFGIIIWRVFSVDHTNFFIDIHTLDAEGNRTLLSQWDRVAHPRFNNVGEAITVTTLFTTLKYYPAQDALFTERLLRYARTLPCPPGGRLVFEYRSVRKLETEFSFVTVIEYVVDPVAGTIDAVPIEREFSVHSAHATSPVRPGVRPGSYLPAR